MTTLIATQGMYRRKIGNKCLTRDQFIVSVSLRDTISLELPSPARMVPWSVKESRPRTAREVRED